MVTELLRSRSPSGAAAPSGLYVARRDGAEVLLPATGAPVTVSAPGGGLAFFGAWTAIGTPGADFLLSQVHFVGVDPAVALGAWLLELSYGASYVARDAVRFNHPTSDPTVDAASYVPASHVGRGVVFPGGEVVYGRLSVTVAAKDAQVFLAGWSGGLPTWVALASNVPAGPGRYYPSNVSTPGLNVLTGAGWAYGAPSTVVDPAPNDMLVHELVTIATGLMFSNTGCAVQVGYGPAGSETWCATVPLGHMVNPPDIYPPVLVLAGERLALRGAGNTAVNRAFLVKVYDL